jgi:hypothetical protein
MLIMLVVFLRLVLVQMIAAYFQQYCVFTVLFVNVTPAERYRVTILKAWAGMKKNCWLS